MEGWLLSSRRATAQSTNTAFVALASRIGVCAIHSTMTAFGTHGGDGQPLGTYSSQVVLGARAVSPQTMAEAYAGLADHGTLCDVLPVTRVVRGGAYPVGPAAGLPAVPVALVGVHQPDIGLPARQVEPVARRQDLFAVPVGKAPEAIRQVQ